MHLGLNVALLVDAILKVEAKLHEEVLNKADNTILLNLEDEALWEVTDKEIAINI